MIKLFFVITWIKKYNKKSYVQTNVELVAQREGITNSKSRCKLS